MSTHGSRPEPSGIREKSAADPRSPGLAEGPPASPDSPPLPAAWQPFTFRGVAAFSRTRFGRVLVAQLIVALALAASVIWFLQNTWFPRALEAIRALPRTGSIEGGQLSTPRTTAAPLAADHFISFAINFEQAPSPGEVADVRVELHRRNFTICSILGCLLGYYPPGTVQFNQPELEAWWGAWRITLYAAIILGVVTFLFASWLVLACLYIVPVALTAYFKDRDVSLAGCWKLTCAALLTPALALGAGIALYGLGWIDLLRLLILWILHFPMGWIYLHYAIRRLPPVQVPGTPGSPKVNPFTEPKSKKPPRRNPFKKGES